MPKFKDSEIKESDALKLSFLAKVDSVKKIHLNPSGNDVLVENSERLIRGQKDITFLRQQLENKDEVIHSLLQQLAKRKTSSRSHETY